ncbi:DUF2057 domain-containing protein [Marinobacter salinexigens]|uniref:DUF2057 domain-containing protein n=1 Tax=Marinobacter salinexigens TaxID=2919747 RepID=A0A5B0VBX0_9GAMM|nr:DUF2057 family protein [Marinobacter salinexigens]KAA1171675.1 DUF2057 domain-containing protein [Marinobacter salinexigens]
MNNRYAQGKDAGLWLSLGRSAKLVFVALMVSGLAACSSTMARVETWEGQPDSAANAATLKAPAAIKVAQVNGRSMTNYLMDDLALEYALLPGKNQVVFSHKSIWAKSGVVENGESKVHVYESEPQVVTFEAEPGEIYQFDFTHAGNRQEAEALSKDFSATVVTANGSVVAESSAWDPQSALARTPISSGEQAAVGAGAGTALDTLKSVWATATDDEKKAFLRWAFE